MKNRTLIFALVLTLALAFAMPAQDAQAKKVLLKTQAMFSLSMPLLGKPLVWFSDMMEKASDGQIVFKLYDPGKLVPVTEILEAVSKGHISRPATTRPPSGWARCRLRPHFRQRALWTRGSGVHGLDVQGRRPETVAGSL